MRTLDIIISKKKRLAAVRRRDAAGNFGGGPAGVRLAKPPEPTQDGPPR